MRVKELIGRKIIDAAGNEVGELEDVEIDFEQKKFEGISVSGKGEMAQKLIERLGGDKSDIVIPVEDISVIGTVIILSKKMT
jgi:sporulation protein YlmC with PRC-barrel domain